ncbi:hypothetical protein L3V83_15680, partial [Thiotrichales bacterium 19X7-9]|nr:hypothetical protein [Thiotrichales bacterium 19X7-9]
YFNEIRQAVEQKLIHPNEYKSLLITPNQAGFTPLHSALKSGNPDNMEAYFNEIRQAVKQGWITLDEYKNLLITPNQAGFTPLHQALKSGNPDNMEAYFDEIRQAGKQGWITLDEYKSLLITPNRAGFTPLHQAANSGSLSILKSFVSGKLKPIFYGDGYCTLLNSKNKLGYRPRCQNGNGEFSQINDFLQQERRDNSNPPSLFGSLETISKGDSNEMSL